MSPPSSPSPPSPSARTPPPSVRAPPASAPDQCDSAISLPRTPHRRPAGDNDNHPATAAPTTGNANADNTSASSTAANRLRRRPSTRASPLAPRSSLHCPICLSLMQDPSVARCGHSFCRACILAYVGHSAAAAAAATAATAAAAAAAAAAATSAIRMRPSGASASAAAAAATSSAAPATSPTSAPPAPFVAAAPPVRPPAPSAVATARNNSNPTQRAPPSRPVAPGTRAAATPAAGDANAALSAAAVLRLQRPQERGQDSMHLQPPSQNARTSSAQQPSDAQRPVPMRALRQHSPATTSDVQPPHRPQQRQRRRPRSPSANLLQQNERQQKTSKVADPPKPCPVCKVELAEPAVYPNKALHALVVAAERGRGSRNGTGAAAFNGAEDGSGISVRLRGFSSRDNVADRELAGVSGSDIRYGDDLAVPETEFVDVDSLRDDDADRLLSQLLARRRRRQATNSALRAALALPFLERCRDEARVALERMNDDIRFVTADIECVRAGLSSLPGGDQGADAIIVGDAETKRKASLVKRYHDVIKSVYLQRRRARADQALDGVVDMLVDATSVSSVTKRASIPHFDIMSGNHNLISSIEFNAGATLFATAGVAKRIKIFDFASLFDSFTSSDGEAGIGEAEADDDDDDAAQGDLPVTPSRQRSRRRRIRGGAEEEGQPHQRHQRRSRSQGERSEQQHYPILEVTAPAKLSCVSWSRERPALLAASTYEGEILVHDTEANNLALSLREHTKRAWFVDFSSLKPGLLLSSSDDNTVKLWDVRSPTSTMTLRTAAIVCCGQFNPAEENEFAFGSADHNVYSYDLRYPDTPLCVFEGHWRAVSHVLFLNRSELVSASTDSSCKLWNVQKQEPGLSYAGHLNDNYFVGLCGSRDFFACGSEDHSVCVYHKGFTGPVVRHTFGSGDGFVSSVAWRPNSRWLVAANNGGCVEILELQ